MLQNDRYFCKWWPVLDHLKARGQTEGSFCLAHEAIHHCESCKSQDVLLLFWTGRSLKDCDFYAIIRSNSNRRAANRSSFIDSLTVTLIFCALRWISVWHPRSKMSTLLVFFGNWAWPGLKSFDCDCAWSPHRLLMQLPYIDDRRLILFGKVTLFRSSGSVGSHMHLFFQHFCVFHPQAFGGYLTLKMLAATDKLFQCAAAAAPITDFRFYSKYRLWSRSLRDSRPL